MIPNATAKVSHQMSNFELDVEQAKVSPIVLNSPDGYEETDEVI